MPEPESGRRKVEYVLFDMDGLMLDSEKIYSIATNAVLEKFGKEMTWEMKIGCMGKPEREAGLHLLSFFPDIDLTLDAYLAERNRLQDELWPTVPVLPGVRKLVVHLKEHNIPMAVATSSRRRNFELKTAHHHDLFAMFDGRITCSDDAQYKMQGKPAPDIFLIAAKGFLGRDVGDPETEPSITQLEERGKGLIFEDSLPGLQAGKRAGMSVVWVPDPNVLRLSEVGAEKADLTLNSLEAFKPEEWGLPPY